MNPPSAETSSIGVASARLRSECASTPFRPAIRATLAPMLEPFASDDGYQIPSLALGVAAAAL
jgi:hypothetical protein